MSSTTSSAIPRSPDAFELGPDGERALMVVTAKDPSRDARLALFGAMVRVHGGGLLEIPLADIQDAQVTNDRPGTVIMGSVGALAPSLLFFGFSGDMPPAIAMLGALGAAGLVLGIAGIGHARLVLYTAKTQHAFTVAGKHREDARRLVAFLRGMAPTGGRAPPGLLRFAWESVVTVFSSDDTLLERPGGGAPAGDQRARTLRIARRVAAWNSSFAVFIPLVVASGLQLAWPVEWSAALLRALVVVPVTSLLGLVLQARLFPLLKERFER